MLELFVFFIIGVTGGFGHCVLMCHPFVLYISTKYTDGAPGYAAMLKPHFYYNLGRIITYCILGAVAGFAGSVVQYAGYFVNIQKAATLAGGIALVLFALLSLTGIRFHLFAKIFDRLKQRGYIKPVSPLVTGLFLGLLPCGLSMGAIIGAASSGSAVRGFLTTLFFGLGTCAAMFSMALFGNAAIKYVKGFGVAGRVLLLVTGIYFIYKAIIY